MGYNMNKQILSIGWIFFLLFSTNLVISGEQGEVNLVIYAPDSVLEEEEFPVQVTDNLSNPIENAIVTDEWTGENHFTGPLGFVTLIAPSVDQTTNFTIIASKAGYEPDTFWITVFLNDSGQTQEALTISAPSSVNENQSFDITVFTAGGLPVENVRITVGWNGHAYYTNSEGAVTIIAPEVIQDTEYILNASKEGYLPNEAEITVLNQETITIQLLKPNGGENWSGNQDIEWVINASTNDYTLTIQYRFGESGEWDIIAELENITSPYSWDTTTVSDGSLYWIQVSLKKNGNIVSEDESDNPFTIFNLGRIFGIVTDGDMEPLYGVSICAKESPTKSICSFTDEAGQYVLSLSPSTYTIEASMDGYVTSSKGNIEIKEKTAVELGFSLVVSIEPTEEGGMADYILNDQIEEGNVGAKIEADHVTLYADLTVDIVSAQPLSEGEVSIKVRGEGEGTILAIYVAGVEDPNKVVLTYDNVKIERIYDVLSFLTSQNTEVGWVLLPTEREGEYVVLLYTEFSEHTITIKSIIDTLGGLNAVLMYIAFCIVIIIAATFHMKFIWKR